MSEITYTKSWAQHRVNNYPKRHIGMTDPEIISYEINTIGMGIDVEATAGNKYCTIKYQSGGQMAFHIFNKIVSILRGKGFGVEYHDSEYSDMLLELNWTIYMGIEWV